MCDVDGYIDITNKFSEAISSLLVYSVPVLIDGLLYILGVRFQSDLGPGVCFNHGF